MDLTNLKSSLQKNKWLFSLPIVLTAILIAFAFNFNIIKSVEYEFSGYLKNLVSKTNKNEKLVVIEYSQKNINRAEIAGFIQTLSDINASSILLDLDLTSSSSSEVDDNMLSLTLKANNRGKTVLPVYDTNNNIAKPLSIFSKFAKLGYVDINLYGYKYFIPIELNHRTAATKYTHAVLRQLGKPGSEYNETIIEPGLNIESVKKFTFSDVIKTNNYEMLSGKHVQIGPKSHRTDIHALLFNTLANGEFAFAPVYFALIIFCVLAFLLTYAFSKNNKRSNIISLSLLFLVIPIAINLSSLYLFRLLLPGLSISLGLVFIVSLLSYIYHEKLSFSFSSETIKGDSPAIEKSHGFLEGELSIGKNGVILKVDPIITKLLGYKTENLVGKPFRNIVPELKQEKWRSFYNMLMKLNNPNDHVYDLKAKHSNGKPIKIQLQPKSFKSNNNLSVRFSLRNTLGKSGKQVALEYQAKQDVISRTLNKEGVIEHLSNKIKMSESKTKISAIVFRLNNFDEISNALGDQASDKILKTFASRLYKYTDENTAIGRIHTAEFLLIKQCGINENNGQSLANKVIRSSKSSIHTSGISIQLSLHAGIADYPSHAKSATQLILNARTALKYAIKNLEPVNTFNIKHDKIKPKLDKKVSEIQKALKENQFKLLYQPVISMNDYSVISVEALLRWKHPEHGLIMPSKFIDKVEGSKLVRPVTTWVIKKALSDAYSWKKHGLNLKISVNISERNLLDAYFPKLVEECISSHRMNPSDLELEVSEEDLQSVSEQSIKVLNSLKKRGIKFTLDNYGKGNTSLVYLKKLPISTIKIDRSLTSNVIKSKQDGAIIDAIIRMAQGLGIDVVAEGVESELHYKKLKHLNCNHCQGHLFSRPVSRKGLIRLFEAWENTFNSGEDGDEIPAGAMATWNGQYYK